MTALTLTLKNNVLSDKQETRLDCRKLTPSYLAKFTPKQIAELKLSSHQHALKVADFFEVSGDDTSHIVFKNSNTQLDYIGHHMKNGQITIEGNIGNFLGANMRGGQIICQGNAGDRVGDMMRRGLILIDGDAGSYCGSRMIAGTIGVYGKVNSHIGYGLRRGTLIVTQKPELLATWQDCGIHTLPFLSLMFNALKPLNSKLATLNNTRAQRWMGDLSQNGTGEILLIQS